MVATLLGNLEEFVANEATGTRVLVPRVAVLARQFVVSELRKAVGQLGAALNFLLENVLFVEKENEARIAEILAEPDVLK